MSRENTSSDQGDSSDWGNIQIRLAACSVFRIRHACAIGLRGNLRPGEISDRGKTETVTQDRDLPCKQLEDRNPVSSACATLLYLLTASYCSQ